MKKQFPAIYKGIKISGGILLSLALAFTSPVFAEITIGEDQPASSINGRFITGSSVISRYQEKTLNDIILLEFGTF